MEGNSAAGAWESAEMRRRLCGSDDDAVGAEFLGGRRSISVHKGVERLDDACGRKSRGVKADPAGGSALTAARRRSYQKEIDKSLVLKIEHKRNIEEIYPGLKDLSPRSLLKCRGEFLDLRLRFLGRRRHRCWRGRRGRR